MCCVCRKIKHFVPSFHSGWQSVLECEPSTCQHISLLQTFSIQLDFNCTFRASCLAHACHGHTLQLSTLGCLYRLVVSSNYVRPTHWTFKKIALGSKHAPRCDPSTYQPISRWHSHSATRAGRLQTHTFLHLYIYICADIASSWNVSDKPYWKLYTLKPSSNFQHASD